MSLIISIYIGSAYKLIILISAIETTLKACYYSELDELLFRTYINGMLTLFPCVK